MAVDKLVDSAQLDSDVGDIAIAIRTKGGTSAQLTFPSGFISAIEAITTGITPTGTINITQSGNTDVTNYATANVASGSATTPATSITANPTISVNASGLITASVSGSQSVTPTVSSGYVSSGTSGTISVSGSNTSQLTVYNGAHHQPVPTDYSVTISLTNPVNGSDFESCEICEATNSTDYYNLNKIGEITSPTGNATVSVDTDLYGIVIKPIGVGSYQDVGSATVSCTGGASLGYKSFVITIEVTADGTVTLDGLNWYDD